MTEPTDREHGSSQPDAAVFRLSERFQDRAGRGRNWGLPQRSNAFRLLEAQRAVSRHDRYVKEHELFGRSIPEWGSSAYPQGAASKNYPSPLRVQELRQNFWFAVVGLSTLCAALAFSLYIVTSTRDPACDDPPKHTLRAK